MHTPFNVELPNLIRQHMWERACFLGASHASHPKTADFQSSPILKVLLYLCRHPLTQNDQIRHGNTYGKGVVLGQSLHGICRNASRDLSTTAEFPVDGNSIPCSSRYYLLLPE